MITHGNEQIEKQIATLLHLHLHRPTALKRRPTTDNQRQIVRAQLGLSIRRVRVCVPRTQQDCVTLDTRMEALLAQCETF